MAVLVVLQLLAAPLLPLVKVMLVEVLLEAPITTTVAVAVVLVQREHRVLIAQAQEEMELRPQLREPQSPVQAVVAVRLHPINQTQPHPVVLAVVVLVARKVLLTESMAQ